MQGAAKYVWAHPLFGSCVTSGGSAWDSGSPQKQLSRARSLGIPFDDTPGSYDIRATPSPETCHQLPGEILINETLQ